MGFLSIFSRNDAVSLNRTISHWKDSMLTVERPVDLVAYVGEKLGASDWVLVDQAMIDKFAAATLDEAWFHVDPERSARDMPGGRSRSSPT
jgi:acyl dehydratase